MPSLLVDIVCLALIALFAVVGARRGAVGEAVALAVFAAAVPLAFTAAAALSAPADVAAFVAGAALGLVAARLAGNALLPRRVLSRARGWAGRIGGAVLGAGQAVILLVTATALLPVGGGLPPRAVIEARAYAHLRPIAEGIRGADAAFAPQTVSLPSPTPRSGATVHRPIAWTTVEAGTRTRTRTLPGTVRAAERSPIGFDVGGRVGEVRVEIGATFVEGEVLAAVETDTLSFEVEERRAALSEAEAVLAEVQADHARTVYLHERGVESNAALENAQAALDTAKSRLNVARTRLARARTDVADAELIAPYDGSVAARLVEPAERVTPGQPVLEIQSRDGGLELVVGVPETILASLEMGSTHAVKAPVLDGTAAGVVTEIGARAGEGSSFPVTLAIEGADPALRPGMSAEVRLDLAPRGAVAGVRIPVTAFLPGDGQTSHVFVVDAATGTVRRQEIEVVAVAGEEVVVTGLEPGQRIAAKGLARLRDGQPIDLMGVGVARYNM